MEFLGAAFLVLFHIEHQSLQILTLGMVDIDGVVSRLMELVKDAHLAARLRRGRKDSTSELILAYRLRATECEQQSTLLDKTEPLGVQADISLESVVERGAMLGKGWRVKHHDVVLVRPSFQEAKRILAKSLMAHIAWEVESHIAVRNLDGLGTAVNRVDTLGTTSHGIDREAARVAEHVEHRLTL